MKFSPKMVAKDLLMAGLKQVPVVGFALDVIDAISKSHEALQMSQRVAEIERGMTSFERRMREVVKAEIEGTLQGLSRRDLNGDDFSRHIKNLYEIRQNGWSPALFQGLLERSMHWNELCKNPSHYGTVLPDRQMLDATKLQVFIDADKTRILEVTPFALHALLARQHTDSANSSIVLGKDVWAFVETEQQFVPADDDLLMGDDDMFALVGGGYLGGRGLERPVAATGHSRFCPWCGGRKNSDSHICPHCRRKHFYDPNETGYQMVCGHIMSPHLSFCAECGVPIKLMK